MGRPKGAKNKTAKEKVEEIIENVQGIKGLDVTEVAEAIDELEDLLAGDTEASQPVESGNLGLPSEEPVKTFIGYHPVTGEKVFK